MVLHVINDMDIRSGDIVSSRSAFRYRTSSFSYVKEDFYFSSASRSFIILSDLGRSSMSNGTLPSLSLLFKECEFPNNPYYILFISIVSFYLPLIVMIYVYIHVYAAAKKQARALRSGYKHHWRMKSAKSFAPEFLLRQTGRSRGANSERRRISIKLLSRSRPANT